MAKQKLEGLQKNANIPNSKKGTTTHFAEQRHEGRHIKDDPNYNDVKRDIGVHDNSVNRVKSIGIISSHCKGRNKW